MVGSLGFVGGIHAARALILTRLWAKAPVSTLCSGAIDSGEFGAVPAIALFKVMDSTFRSGSPFDLVAEGSSVFELAAGRPRVAHSSCSKAIDLAISMGTPNAVVRCVRYSTVPTCQAKKKMSSSTPSGRGLPMRARSPMPPPQLYVHPNTVRHRLHRIERHTGRSLAVPDELAEICVAFEARENMPAP
jgi:hypothetical protein